jgi:hypothetical protein
MDSPRGSSPVTRALTAAEALVRLHGRALNALLPHQPSSEEDDDDDPANLRLSKDTFNELSDAHGPGTVVNFMRVGEKGEKRTLFLPGDAADGDGDGEGGGELAYRWTVPRYAAWEKLERCVAGGGQGVWVEVADGFGEGAVDAEAVTETGAGGGFLEGEGVHVYIVKDGDVVEIVRDGDVDRDGGGGEAVGGSEWDGVEELGGGGDGRQEERARGSMVGLFGAVVPEGLEMTAEEWRERVNEAWFSNEREEEQHEEEGKGATEGV